MKRAVALFLITATIILAQSPATVSGGPVYDPAGHLIAYIYPDGKADAYAYDAQWRMTSFHGRDGKQSIFHYDTEAAGKATSRPTAKSPPASARP